MDADIGLRNLDLLLGLENRVVYTAMEVLEGECRLEQALIRDKRWRNLALLPISKNRQRYNVTRDNMNTVLDLLKKSDFDFIFIDADKRNYKNYYEIGLKLLKQNGIIIFDNVLWGGAVADLNDQDKNTLALRELNETLYKDNRIELSMIPVGDGLTIVRKIK